MNGKQKLAEINEDLDKIEKELGLYGIVCSDIVKYINMTEIEITSMSIERCVEIALIISSYSFFLKKEENKYNVQSLKIKDYLDQIVVKEAKQYCDPKFTKFDEKIHLVCNDNDHAKELKDIYIQLLTKKTYLEYLSSSLHNIANNLLELKKAKYEKR